MRKKKMAPKTLMGASGVALSDTCAGCHGTDGASGGPGTPNIGGLSKRLFHRELMKGFKSGEIPSTIMGRISKGYNDDEVKKMAAHFAGRNLCLPNRNSMLQWLPKVPSCMKKAAKNATLMVVLTLKTTQVALLVSGLII